MTHTFFFMYLHLGHPHIPIQIPKSFDSIFGDIEHLPNLSTWSYESGNLDYPGFDDYKENRTKIYDASIRYTDFILGNLVDEITEISNKQTQIKEADKPRISRKITRVEDIDNYQPTQSNTERLIDNTYKRIPGLQNYLTSDTSIDQLPEIQNLIVSHIHSEELAKINQIKLPLEEKEQFIKEFKSQKPESRKWKYMAHLLH